MTATSPDTVGTVVAVGAAGANAGLVVPELARRGVRVRALVRDPAQATAVRARGAAEVAVADLRRPAQVAAALVGADGAFYLAPAFMPDEAAVGVAFVDAAARAGVRRIVFSSVIHPVLGALANHRDKGPVEDAILTSGVEYTFLHPAVFFQNFAGGWPRVAATGVFAEPWSVETRLSRVDYRDVAEAAAEALTGDRLLGGTFELCAAGAPNRREVAALMAEALGRPVRAERVDPAEAVPDAESPMRRMLEWYDHHDLVGNPTTARAVLGREPRSLDAYFQELAAALPVGQAAARAEHARLA